MPFGSSSDSSDLPSFFGLAAAALTLFTLWIAGNPFSRSYKDYDVVFSGPGSDVRVGNALPLREVPLAADVDPRRAGDQLHLPDDLARLFVYAREHSCDWLLIDCDGPQVEELPFAPW